MITLKKLRWNNCFSYGSGNELNLDDHTIVQLVGGNGAGKSSIPIIAEEALFNKNSKGKKKANIPNRHINDGYDIYLSWEKDNDFYEISVLRKASIKVTLLKNGEDISSHTATGTFKTVEEILGCDFKTFSQLVYQHPDSSLQFLTATDTARKKFLIDLLHLENYVALFDTFKDAAKQASSKVLEVNSKIATIEKWLENNKLSDTTILPMLNLDIDMDDDEKRLRYLSKEIENISEKNKKILQNEEFKKLLKQVDSQRSKSTKITDIRSYDDLQSELGTVQSNITNAKTVKQKIEKLGNTCPTCEQPIDSEFRQNLINFEAVKIKECEKALEGITKQIAEIREQNQEIRKAQKLQTQWEELYRSVDYNLPERTLEEAALREEIGEIRDRLNSAKTKIKETAVENERRSRHNTRIQVIQEQTDKFNEELAENVVILNKHEKHLSNLEVLKKAFSTNGLLAYKIENLVKELESAANVYLAELSDGRFTIEFVISKDKLNVQVTDDGNIIDIEDPSSGELAKITTATLLAIRKLMSSISKSKINILFLDEVINVLDEQGREKLIEVLLEEKELNTYVVSHGWAHPLLEKITVKKEDNISCLEK